LRAVTLERFGAALTVGDRAMVAAPGAGEVLVRVVAAGVCGTDLKLWRGDLPGTPLPLIPGHEAAGVVEAVGEDVASPAPGTAVVLFHHLHCGECARCRAGRENLCLRLRGRIGFDHDGGWAEYALAPARNAIPVPEGLAAETACVVPDAVATAWRAVLRVGALADGEGVAVLGCGGLGLTAVQIAQGHGGEILAVDVAEEKLVLAREAGAAHATLPAGAEEAARRLPDGGPALVLDCAGTDESVALALRLLPRGGRLVQVGYSQSATIRIPAADVALRELRLLGCRASSLGDLRAALEAVGDGSVRPLVGEVRPLEEAQAALDTLAARGATGRQVLAVS
jgi:D-arabinose 1-dehydrogenase-like Zn-dependent alcohol dehydrogenase